MENESSQTLDVSIDDDERRSVERMARCTESELAGMIMKQLARYRSGGNGRVAGAIRERELYYGDFGLFVFV